MIVSKKENMEFIFRILENVNEKWQRRNTYMLSVFVYLTLILRDRENENGIPTK